LGAKNEGIRKAKGKIITFLDSDDEFLPDALEKIVDAFSFLKEAKAIFFDCINEKGKITGKWKAKDTFVTFPEHLCRKIYGEFLPALKREEKSIMFLKFAGYIIKKHPIASREKNTSLKIHYRSLVIWRYS